MNQKYFTTFKKNLVKSADFTEKTKQGVCFLNQNSTRKRFHPINSTVLRDQRTQVHGLVSGLFSSEGDQHAANTND